MAIDTAPTGSGTRSAHPLDALDPAEIQAAGNVLRADSRVPDTALFAYFGLDEPSKDAVAGFTAGDPVDRRIRVTLLQEGVGNGPDAQRYGFPRAGGRKGTAARIR